MLTHAYACGFRNFATRAVAVKSAGLASYDLQLIDGKPAIKTPEAIISRDKQAEEA